MKENKLIKYGYPQQFSNEIVYTIEQRRHKSPILKALLSLVIIAISVLLFNKYKSPILNFFDVSGIIEESSSAGEISGSDEESSSTSAQTATQVQLPSSNGYPIYAINGNGTGIFNETSKDYDIFTVRVGFTSH